MSKNFQASAAIIEAKEQNVRVGEHIVVTEEATIPKEKEILKSFWEHPLVFGVLQSASAISAFLSFFSNNRILQICGFVVFVFACISSAIAFYRYCKKRDERAENYRQRERDLLQAHQKEKDEYQKHQGIIVRQSAQRLHNIVTSIQNSIAYQSQVEGMSEEAVLHLAEQECEAIASFYDTLMDNKAKTSVCIKMIDPQSANGPLEVQNWKIYTLARSSSTDPKRCNQDSQRILVQENADFEWILDKNASDELFFAAPFLPNFIKIYEADPKHTKKWRNSTYDFEKYYTATIVVPLMIKMQYVSPGIPKYSNRTNVIPTHHILGFLCLDWLYDFSDETDFFISLIQYAHILADPLYLQFEQIYVNQLHTPKESQSSKD